MRLSTRNFGKKSAFAVGSGIIVFVISLYFSLIFPTVNTREEINKVEVELSQAFADYEKEVAQGIIFLGPLWKDVDKICQTLTRENRRIAKAKVMVRYDRKPDQNDMEIWIDREKLSNQDWQAEDRSMRLLKSIGISAVVGAFSSILLLGLAFVISWTWYFLLERIRELSKAIRG
jgi:hypothetical protein